MSTVTCRTFARTAAAAFAAVALYTVVVKLPRGDAGADATHTVLHIASGAFAAYAGWLARTEWPATLLAIVVAVAYGLLGMVGWFVDGVLLDTPLRIPLAASDNVFHLLLAGAAGSALATADRPIAAER